MTCGLLAAAAAGCSKEKSQATPQLRPHANIAEAKRRVVDIVENPADLARSSIKAPRLRVGDSVGIVACGGPIRHPADIIMAKSNILRLGLLPVLAPHLSEVNGYLAGTDEHRADDFNVFVRDPQIKAIFAIRGGYGATRILDLIDYAQLVSFPKVIVGYSDVVAILNAVTKKTGLITFHGPVVGHGEFTASVMRGLEQAVMTAKPIKTLRSGLVSQQSIYSSLIGRGRIFGGNLSIVAALLGTPYEIPKNETILLLEEVNEAPYRIDRMLTQLRLAGTLSKSTSIALGQFVHCIPNSETDDVPSFTIDETLLNFFQRENHAIVSDLPFGHIGSQATIPIGALARLDGREQTLSVEESAVS